MKMWALGSKLLMGFLVGLHKIVRFLFMDDLVSAYYAELYLESWAAPDYSS
jgi:hypothetical protein